MRAQDTSRRLRRAGAVVAALVVAASIGSTVSARPHHGAMLDRLERRLELLELDGETREAVFDVIDDARAQRSALRPEIREARDRMRELLAADAPDEEAVFAQADAIGALKVEASLARVRTLLALRALLTAEQWQALHPRRGERGQSGDLRE